MLEIIQFQLLLATFASWVGRRQSTEIAYLIEENRVLKEQLESDGKRLRFTNDQRRRLAAKGKPLGRKVLGRIAQNLTDCEDGFLTRKRFLIIDRDAKFSRKFKSILEGSGIEILFTSYLAPNMNAYAERFVKSIKSECLDQMIFLGRDSLVRAIAELSRGAESSGDRECADQRGDAPKRRAH